MAACCPSSAQLHPKQVASGLNSLMVTRFFTPINFNLTSSSKQTIEIHRSPSGGVFIQQNSRLSPVMLSWPWNPQNNTPSRTKLEIEFRVTEVRHENDSLMNPNTDIALSSKGKGNEGSETDDNRNINHNETFFLPHIHVHKPRMQYNAATLAFLGDGIYEVYARRHFLSRHNVETYYKKVMTVVCCEAQDWLLKRLLKKNFLTPEEKDVVRWGRNVSCGSRRAKGRAGNAVYSGATSLETLVGYLYLTNSSRLDELMLELGFDGSGSLVIDLSSET